jgi:hypothetical protein
LAGSIGENTSARFRFKRIELGTTSQANGDYDHLLADINVERKQQQNEALVAGLQKVSAAVELNKQAPTQVADNR